MDQRVQRHTPPGTSQDGAAEQAQAPPLPAGLGHRLLRWVVSLWIVLHFAAILSAALTAVPTSPLVVGIWEVFQPYLQVLYLNHGYSFFAPQPLPTTLLDFEAHRPDGTVVRGRISELASQPRLLYQRHLLLTEHMAGVPDSARSHWYISYARHLCHKYKADRVSLTLLIHSPPTTEMVQHGTRPGDPITYVELPQGSFECGNF
jgi:hypothetical protein